MPERRLAVIDLDFLFPVHFVPRGEGVLAGRQAGNGEAHLAAHIARVERRAVRLAILLLHGWGEPEAHGGAPGGDWCEVCRGRRV